ncbi:glycosyltransferase family 4 protein [Pseudomonas sp. NA-150]|uniref:glycosyltransferase family 4 protein n=1 Tax=Pseudomonas sp. NA-150 TaxID=3367525 RepID=UPI0037C53F38
MRVGLDYRPATIAPMSGIGRQVLALENALVQRDDTELVLMSEAPLGHPQRETALCPAWPSSLEHLQRPQVRFRFERRFLPATLRQEHIDLFIATANMGLPIGRKPSGTRYVLVLHDLFQLTHRNFHRSILTAVAYRFINTLSIAWSVWIADQIWCPSQFSCNEAARIFPWAKSKLRVLHNLVPAFTDPPGELPAGLPDRYWLLVGTREPRKNIAFFIKNWQLSRLENHQVPDLVLLGHPSDIAPELATLPGLHWLSGLSEAQLHALYVNADYLWQPSIAEGFGLPVVEALRVGTHVVVAQGSALDEVAPPSARRFNPRDGVQIRAAIVDVAQTPPSADSQSLIEWAQQFTEPAYRQRLDTLLKELGH